jgi:hypothetical protein
MPEKAITDRPGFARGASRATCLVAFIILPLLSACTGDNAPAPVQPPVPVPYEDLFNAVLDYHLAYVPVLPDGNTIGDFGDSTAYGPAALFTLDHQTGRYDHQSLAGLMAGREALLLQGLDWLPNIVEVYIGNVGTFKSFEFTGEAVYRQTAEQFLDLFNNLLAAIPDLIFLIDGIPYGPTTIVGGVAMYNLQYAFSIGDTPRTGEYTDRGLELIRRVDRQTWDPDLGFYRYSINNEHCSAYPNSIMILALCRAYQATGDAGFLDRARSIAEIVEERLLERSTGGYLGAEDSETAYMALSNNNYLIQSLLFLAEITGDPVYLARVDRALTFVQDFLCEPAEGICYHDLRLHHRMDWFCSGCNWQLLYNILEYRRLLTPPKKPAGGQDAGINSP